jgi:hypothetical protein
MAHPVLNLLEVEALCQSAQTAVRYHRENGNNARTASTPSANMSTIPGTPP